MTNKDINTKAVPEGEINDNELEGVVGGAYEDLMIPIIFGGSDPEASVKGLGTPEASVNEIEDGPEAFILGADGSHDKNLF